MPRTTLRSRDGGGSFMEGLSDNAERMLRLARTRESQQPLGDTQPEEDSPDIGNVQVVDPFAFPNIPPDASAAQEAEEAPAEEEEEEESQPLVVVAAAVVEEGEEAPAEEETVEEAMEEQPVDEGAVTEDEEAIDEAVVDGPMAAEADAAELRVEEAAADEAVVEGAAEEEAVAAMLPARGVPFSAAQARELLRVPVRHGGKGKHSKGKARHRKVLR